MTIDVLMCVICEKAIPTRYGWAGGNNAEPLARGRCCYDCNDIVVLTRIENAMSRSGYVNKVGKWVHSD